MGFIGLSGESPNDSPWEMLKQIPNRPISAPLLTAVLSWRQSYILFGPYVLRSIC